jgi:hypothetical protein
VGQKYHERCREAQQIKIDRQTPVHVVISGKGPTYSESEASYPHHRSQTAADEAIQVRAIAL